MATAATNVPALEKGTGVTWPEWLEFFAANGGEQVDHKQLAVLALGRITEAGVAGNPEWWAQGVAVAYEQHIGRRVPGQDCTGSFNVTVSKTVPGDMDAVLARWTDFMAGLDAVDGVEFAQPATTSETPKWRYWRRGLADGTQLTVTIQTKPAGDRTGLAVNHDKLADADAVERWRAVWKARTAEFAALT